MKLLLIEDEHDLATAIQGYLAQEGYLIEHVTDYAQAMTKADLYEYACIIADITLPGKGTGLDILQHIKQSKPEAAFILISAKGALDDRLAGLNLGADDYLAKPFHLAELSARLKAVIRRRLFSGNTVLTYHEIQIFPDEKRVMVHETVVQLTRSEFDLLLYLVTNKGRVLTKEQLAELLTGDDADQADSHDFVYSHIKNMRKKLTSAGAVDYLVSVYGIGYKFGQKI